MERNFRDTTDKIEIEMKEVKEKLSSLTASVENRTQEGQLVERDITEKIIKSDTALVHGYSNSWMSANTAYFSTLVI